ncbi:PREDICTED: piggyBac transposable element-derived protein 4-like [Eufriesea mexicana]|uniref:piggyBac transposable element-derived protein 4-like n=1 Tax=Eufriesea mexicana TaxID=516756 RepID=UPI00083C14EC|nr:PREDICTED: piggyBac transposable element-derived protein 4-like [Eufriesea mexicana]
MMDSENKYIGKSGAIVEALKPYLRKSHTLYVDNWYLSPVLFNLLDNNCTNECGTVKKRQKGMPKINDRLKREDATPRSSNNLLVIIRHGGKRVIQIPVCVLDHNNSMGTVDKADMVISTVNSTRKSLKWYRKFFFHLLDICVWNAYCLYKHKMKEPISMAQFQLQLIREILGKYDQSTNHQRRTSNNHPPK